MARYVGRRLLSTVLVVVMAISAIFFMMFLRGDPSTLLIPPEAPAEVAAQLRAQMGFDRPVLIQYLTYMERVILHADFGQSFRQPGPAMDRVLSAVPNSALLAGLSLGFALIVGVPLGVIAAYRSGVIDRLVIGMTVLLQAMPNFWIGLVLIVIFSVKLNLLPTGGFRTSAGLVLPVATLAFSSLGRIARLTRSSVLEQLHADYIRTARAKGLGERVVLYRHALRAALGPIISISALQFGVLFGGAVITETVFAWPGLGRLLAQSIAWRDFPVVMAGVALISASVSLLNLVADVMHAWADPVIRYE